MKLTFELIAYHLSERFEIRILARGGKDEKYERPVFYRKGLALSRYVIIVTIPELEALIAGQGGVSPEHNLFLLAGASSDMEQGRMAFPKWNGNSAPAARPAKFSVISLPDGVSGIEAFTSLQEIFDLFEEWDQTLCKLVLERGSLRQLTAACGRVIASPFAILDVSNHYRAFSDRYYQEYIVPNHVGADMSTPWKYVNDTAMRENWNAICAEKDIFLFSFADTECTIMGKNLFLNGENLGHIGLVLERQEDYGYYADILRHFHYYVEQLYIRDRSSLIRRQENRLHEILKQLMSGEPVTPGMWAQFCAEEEWQPDDSLQVASFELNPSYNAERYDETLHITNLNDELNSRWKGVIPFGFEDGQYVLVNRKRFQSEDEDGFYQALAYFLRENLLIAGVSRCFSQGKFLMDAVFQTRAALRLGSRDGSTSWYYLFDDYVCQYLNQKMTSDISARMLASPALQKLLDYDARKKTEYYHTLRVFFQCQFNATETAKKLCIQRSSFLYRMERIKEMMGIASFSYEEVRYLFLSFGLLDDEYR